MRKRIALTCVLAVAVLAAVAGGGAWGSWIDQAVASIGGE